MFHSFAEKLVQEIGEGSENSSTKQKTQNSSAQSPIISSADMSFTLEIDEANIIISDRSPGMALFCTIGATSLENQEALFTTMLRGNFLGQATRNASLGLDETGQKMVLHRTISTIQHYRHFRETVEDFINTVSFWQEYIKNKPES